MLKVVQASDQSSLFCIPSPRNDLLVGPFLSRLDFPLVFLAGPGEFGALVISLNTIMVKRLW